MVFLQSSDFFIAVSRQDRESMCRKGSPMPASTLLHSVLSFFILIRAALGVAFRVRDEKVLDMALSN
jgi:hypothetical protein